MSNGVAKGSSKLPAQLTIHVSMFICFQPTNHQHCTAKLLSVEELEANLRSQTKLKIWANHIAFFVCSRFRFSHCNFRFTNCHSSRFTVLVFVKRELCAVVLVFVTKVALLHSGQF